MLIQQIRIPRFIVQVVSLCNIILKYRPPWLDKYTLPSGSIDDLSLLLVVYDAFDCVLHFAVFGWVAWRFAGRCFWRRSWCDYALACGTVLDGVGVGEADASRFIWTTYWLTQKFTWFYAFVLWYSELALLYLSFTSAGWLGTLSHLWNFFFFASGFIFDVYIAIRIIELPECVIVSARHNWLISVGIRFLHICGVLTKAHVFLRLTVQVQGFRWFFFDLIGLRRWILYTLVRIGHLRIGRSLNILRWWFWFSPSRWYVLFRFTFFIYFGQVWPKSITCLRNKGRFASFWLYLFCAVLLIFLNDFILLLYPLHLHLSFNFINFAFIFWRLDPQTSSAVPQVIGNDISHFWFDAFGLYSCRWFFLNTLGISWLEELLLLSLIIIAIRIEAAFALWKHLLLDLLLAGIQPWLRVWIQFGWQDLRCSWGVQWFVFIWCYLPFLIRVLSFRFDFHGHHDLMLPEIVGHRRRIDLRFELKLIYHTSQRPDFLRFGLSTVSYWYFLFMLTLHFTYIFLFFLIVFGFSFIGHIQI